MRIKCFALLLVLLLTVPTIAQGVEVIRITHIIYPQMDDGLYYIMCIQGCENFDAVVSSKANVGWPTQWEAANGYLYLWAQYSGITYVPLPPPPAGSAKP